MVVDGLVEVEEVVALVEVARVVDVDEGLVEVAVVEVVVVTGSPPPAPSSTQYDWPTFRPVQSAPMEGFILRNSSIVM